MPASLMTPPKPLLLLLFALAACSSDPLQAPGHPDGQVRPRLVDPVPAEWGEAELLAAIEDCGPDQVQFRADLRRRLLDFQPEDAELKLLLGRDLIELGHLSLAETLLQEVEPDQQYGVPATLALANLQEERGRFLVAASLLEQRAAQTEVEQRRTLLERASRLRQKGGDLPGALRNLEQALEGIRVSDGEQRLLDQMRAYQNGEFAHAEDATRVLHQHQSADLRLKALQYLAAQADTSAAVFADALGDESEAVLQLAIDELLERGDSMEAPSLLPLLDHESVSIRQAATEALGKFESVEAAELIMARFEADDRSMFRCQNLALERICRHSVAPDLDPDADRRRQIADLWLDWWNSRS